MGGLSALAWDAKADLFHALADDPGEHGPPRLYRLRLVFDGPAPTAELLSWRPLQDALGEPYESWVADPEGLALLPDGSLLVASEGLADRAVDPFLRRFSTDGRELERIALPARYLPTADGSSGVRASLGFESLTVDATGRRIYLATEGPLAQDGPPADLEVASLARVLTLSWPETRPLSEHAYQIEPLRLTPQPRDAFRIAGLVELLALDGGRLLALERQFAVGDGFSQRLYAIGLPGATDLMEVEALADAPLPRTICKKLLLDFADLGLELANLEGLARGPALADGRQTIIVVEDDDFGGGPAARFLRLALHHGLFSDSSRLAVARPCW